MCVYVYVYMYVCMYRSRDRNFNDGLLLFLLLLLLLRLLLRDPKSIFSRVPRRREKERERSFVPIVDFSIFNVPLRMFVRINPPPRRTLPS